MSLMVKVISAERQSLWYAEHIGIEVEVTEHNDNLYYMVVPLDNDPEPWKTHLIFKKDCEVVDELSYLRN